MVDVALSSNSDSSRNFGDVLAQNKGVAPGFDFLRIFLSVSILLGHCYGVATVSELPDLLIKPISYCFLPMFFGISGFLVTGSAVRAKSLRVYLTFRALRILPALATEVALSAFLIGPFVTTLPLHSYFTDTRFFEYFGNIVGRVQTGLPGAFEDIPGLNGNTNLNLWTLKPEFYCYAIMAALIITSTVRLKPLLVLSGILTLGVVALALGGLESLNGHFRWHLLVLSFVLGSLAYVAKDQIPVSFTAAFISIAAALTIVQTYNSLLIPLSVPLIVYSTICFGMARLPLSKWLRKEDYSYGIYLYGYPIMALLVYSSPLFRSPLLLAAADLVITVAFAMSSWHLIEKPFLKLRRRLLPAARVIEHE